MLLKFDSEGLTKAHHEDMPAHNDVLLIFLGNNSPRQGHKDQGRGNNWELYCIVPAVDV